MIGFALRFGDAAERGVDVRSNEKSEESKENEIERHSFLMD